MNCIVCEKELRSPETAPLNTCGSTACILALALKYRAERDRYRALLEGTLKRLDGALNGIAVRI